MSIRAVLFKLIYALASVITVIVFFTGFGSLGQFHFEWESIPLMQTIIKNPGWLNTLIYVVLLSSISIYIENKKKLRLRKYIKKEKSNWYKENHLPSIVSEINSLDKKSKLLDDSSMFIFFCLVLIAVYNSSLLTSQVITISFGDDDMINVTELITNEKNPPRLEVKIIKPLQHSVNGGLVDLAKNISPFPLDTFSKLTYTKKNSFGIFIPEKPLLDVDSGWLFILYLFIFYAPIMLLQESYIKLEFLLHVKKSIPRNLKRSKIELLISLIKGHKCKDMEIEKLSASLINSLEKRL